MKSQADREQAVRDMLARNGIGHLADRVLQVLTTPAGSRDPHYDLVAGLVYERAQLVEDAGRILERVMAIDEELREMEATMRRVLAVLDAAERSRRAGE